MLSNCLHFNCMHFNCPHFNCLYFNCCHVASSKKSPETLWLTLLCQRNLASLLSRSELLHKRDSQDFWLRWATYWWVGDSGGGEYGPVPPRLRLHLCYYRNETKKNRELQPFQGIQHYHSFRLILCIHTSYIKLL